MKYYDLEEMFPLLDPNTAKQKYKEPEEDEEGYVKMQLWEVMQIFGPYLHTGINDMFENNIRIED